MITITDRQATKSLYTFLYTTPISLGTPPQSFNAIIDTIWTDLFVPSLPCGGSHCPELAKYNASASSTYRENGTVKRTTYGPLLAYGKESIDTLSLGDLSVPQHHFQALNFYEMVYPDDGLEGWDSVLGLAYEREEWMDDPRSPNTLSSPFRRVVESKVLDSNLISLKLPRNDPDTGDIVFGDLNEDLFVEGSMAWNSLYPANTTQWQIEVVSVSMVKEGKKITAPTALVNKSPTSYSALVMTAWPILAFPHALGRELLSRLPLEPSSCGGEMVIPCSSIPDLPDLVIEFRSGQETALKGEDYVAKLTMPWCREPVVECLPLIEAFPEHAPGFEIPKDLLVLGGAVLKNVYSVFDWDERRVGWGTKGDGRCVEEGI